MDPITILTALLPVASDGIKAVIGRFTGGKPAVITADDYAKIQDADIKKLEAIAKLDVPTGQTSEWVNDVRAMQRPVVVCVVMIAWVWCVVTPVHDSVLQLVSNLASAVFFYLFGERAMFHLKKGAK